MVDIKISRYRSIVLSLSLSLSLSLFLAPPSLSYKFAFLIFNFSFNSFFIFFVCFWFFATFLHLLLFFRLLFSFPFFSSFLLFSFFLRTIVSSSKTTEDDAVPNLHRATLRIFTLNDLVTHLQLLCVMVIRFLRRKYLVTYVFDFDIDFVCRQIKWTL